MLKSVSSSSSKQAASQRQALVLIVIGILCLLGALLLHLNSLKYPFGLLVLGLGMLVAVAFYPYRLIIAAVMISCVGVAIFFAYSPSPLVPYSTGLLVLMIGVALVIISLAARQGYVGNAPLSPAILVIIVGLLLFGPIMKLWPHNFAAFILSLWFPGIALLLLGIIYFLLAVRRVR